MNINMKHYQMAGAYSLFPRDRSENNEDMPQMTEEERDSLIKLITKYKLNLDDRIKTILNEENKKFNESFLYELIGLMHKYGIYFNPEAAIYDDKEINNLKGIEVGFNGEKICFDTDGDLARRYGNQGFAILPLTPPNAHQKMAQAALRQKILDGDK